ncbi:MAG: hypothetical protein WCW02_01005 [Candidatus Buchananbacteria bacterium]
MKEYTWSFANLNIFIHLASLIAMLSAAISVLFGTNELAFLFSISGLLLPLIFLWLIGPYNQPSNDQANFDPWAIRTWWILHYLAYLILYAIATFCVFILFLLWPNNITWSLTRLCFFSGGGSMFMLIVCIGLKNFLEPTI